MDNHNVIKIGNGILCQIEADGKILLEIDTNQSYGPSSSGKSMQIASSGGNVELELPNGKTVKLGINCFKPIPLLQRKVS